MSIFIAFFSALVLSTGIQPATSQEAALRIVVVEGEDAVNIIQQKTAVAPIVEIRDRNNLPVAGATVTFTIGGNAASFAGGVQSLTVVTNAAGQAVAAGISPLTSGALQINVAAAFQGQTAVATIAQTNVLTAAQAASVATSSTGGASGTGSTGATGGAAGGGGGLSGTTLGIIGGAVGAGALVATQVAGGGDDAPASSGTTTPTTTTTTTTPTTTTNPTPQPTTVTYNGPLAGTFTSTGTADIVTCTFTYNLTGTMRIVLETRPDGSVSGTASGSMSFREASAACNFPLTGFDPDGSDNGAIPFSGPVTGTASSLRFIQTDNQTIPVQGGNVQTSFETAFSGSVSGGAINGQLTLRSSSTFNVPGGLNLRGSGTGGAPSVSLRP
jgi:hypothetical protein